MELCENIFGNLNTKMNIEAFKLIKALNDNCKIRIKKNSVVIAFNLKNSYCRVFFKDSMDFVLRYNSTVRSGIKTFKILKIQTLQELKEQLEININDISNCKNQISKDAETKLNIFKQIVKIL